MLRRAAEALVLFDEAHCEAWTIRPPLAAAMSPWSPSPRLLWPCGGSAAVA